MSSKKGFFINVRLKTLTADGRYFRYFSFTAKVSAVINGLIWLKKMIA